LYQNFGYRQKIDTAKPYHKKNVITQKIFLFYTDKSVSEFWIQYYEKYISIFLIQPSCIRISNTILREKYFYFLYPDFKYNLKKKYFILLRQKKGRIRISDTTL